MRNNIFLASMEVKFAADATPGEFEGYASVFGNQDSHGDMIMPGAFTDTLAERKASGRALPMHVMHGIFGGDGIPVGVWKAIDQDDKGLFTKGKISGVDTDAGKLLHARVKDGALPGLSIGFSVRPNGSVKGTKAGEPARTLSALNLHEISLVSEPSNPEAIVASVKGAADADKAAASLAAAMRLHDKSMGDGYSYGSTKDKAKLMNHLRDAHMALTGSSAPDDLDDWKAAITRDAFEAKMRQSLDISADAARQLADTVFGPVIRTGPDLKTVAADLAFLANFSLVS